jgi:hypothetical protein
VRHNNNRYYTHNSGRCPHCGSQNILPVSKKTLLMGAAGGTIGGLLSFAISYAMDRQPVATIILGIFSGATVGFKFGQKADKDTKDTLCFCIDCFDFFKTRNYSASKNDANPFEVSGFMMDDEYDEFDGYYE